MRNHFLFTSVMLVIYFVIYVDDFGLVLNTFSAVINEEATIISFLYDYMVFSGWTYAVIITDNSISAKNLWKELSLRNISVLVTSNTSAEFMFNLLDRDFRTMHLVALGRQNIVLDALQMIINFNILASKSSVLLFCIDCSSLPKIIQAKDIFGEALWAIPSKLTNSILLNEIHYSYSMKMFKTKMIGKWTFSGLELHKERLVQTLQLEGVKLQLQIIMPYDITDELLTETYHPLAAIFAKQLNFSYRIVGNRIRVDNDLNQIINSSYAMTMSPITMTPGRIKYVDFTSPFTHEEVLFIVAETSNSANSYVWFFRPFQTSIWLATAVFIFLTLCFLKITYNCSSHNRTGIGWFNLAFSFFFKEDELNPYQRVSTRIVITTAHITCWLLFALYSGILTSYLTWDPQSKVTLQDLQASNTKIGCFVGSSLEILTTSENPILKSFRKRVLVINYNESYALNFCKQKWAFHGSESSVHTFARTASNICRVTFIKERAYAVNNRFTVKKGDVFGKRISRIITKLHEYGILLRLKRLYRHKEKQELDYSVVPISISHLKGLLCLMGIGIGLALLTLILEIYHYQISTHVL